MQNDIKNELGKNFIEYVVACNTDRAIPNAADGLKPVAKRILWSCFEEGRTFNKPHVKSARIVGDVMGKYHPHGDSSIYGAEVRLSQKWVLRYPLIDWHGSNGNIAGDGPAAMRYTESRLSKLAEDGLLKGLKKKNVDFIPNFDETLEEPVELPSIFPNLLCNPNTGIGVAMACNWLPHNLNEVAQAIYDFMDGKEPMLPGPDFPTGGVIINKNDIPAIMRTGHGSVKVRGKYKVEKNNLVFYEIPYGTSTENLLAEIGKVCDEKEIEGISEIRDESNKKGLRIVVECDKGVNPDAIAQKLYAKTNLQTSISYNQVALIDKTPMELTLADCCNVYVSFNIKCLIKELQYDLQEKNARLHIVDGLLIALEDIDNVIALIKKSESSAAAKIALIEKYKLSEIQAKSILAMRLSSLAHLEKVELQNEKKDLLTQIEDITKILANKDLQTQKIRERLETIVAKYGDARRTELAQIEIPKETKEKIIEQIIPEDVVVIITQDNTIKRIPRASFKVQGRAGKGVKTEDAILATISASTTDKLMMFTDKGKSYNILVNNIPAGTNASKGSRISTICALESNEKVMAATSLHHKSTAKYAVFATKNGLIKKTVLEEYDTKKSTGVIAIKLKDDDAIAAVTFLEEEEIILLTKKGMSIHFETSSITPVGRATMGIKGIKLLDGDEVIAMLPIHKTTDDVMIVSHEGMVKRISLSEFPLQGKNGKGVIASTQEIVGGAMVDDNDALLLIGRPNSICIKTKDIPIKARSAMGVIGIKDSKVLRAIKL